MVSGESLVSETVLHGFLMLGGLCSCSVQSVVFWPQDSPTSRPQGSSFDVYQDGARPSKPDFPVKTKMAAGISTQSRSRQCQSLCWRGAELPQGNTLQQQKMWGGGQAADAWFSEKGVTGRGYRRVMKHSEPAASSSRFKGELWAKHARLSQCPPTWEANVHPASTRSLPKLCSAMTRTWGVWGQHEVGTGDSRAFKTEGEGEREESSREKPTVPGQPSSL